MRAVIVHSLPGRVRLRVMPGALAPESVQTVGGIPGIKSAQISIRTGSILIFYDYKNIPEESIVRAVRDIPLEITDKTKPKKKAGDKTSMAPRVGPVWGYIAYQIRRLLIPPALKPWWTLISAIPFFIAGLKSLMRGKLDVAVLDASAIGASLIQQNINSGSTLIMLLKTGEFLEDWAKQRSRENLAAGLSLHVGKVWIKGDDGVEHEIAYEELRPGDKIVLRAGTMIPVDGKVLDGRALVNEAALTGEPLGIEKSLDKRVHAGTVVEEGELLVEVLKKGEDTRYQQIIKLIEESEGAKADTEIKSLLIAAKAVPFTFALAGLTWLITRDPKKAASVISVDYSCAIKLATPLAFLSAIREGLSNGVFFKGGAPMEKLSKVDTVIFDKTGTLTRASPALERVITYGDLSEDKALKIAACLEEHFPHPVARAVVDAACERNLRHREDHSQVKYIAAHGLATDYKGKHVVIGSRHFVGDDEGADLSPAEKDEEYASEEGFSTLYLAEEKKLLAVLLIKDPPREEAAEVIAMLRALGIKRFYLLSGDNKKTAERIARALSLDGGLGELLPQDKMQIIKNLQKSGCVTAFVGDGMNDSPAMSQADVGIAMKDGADLARETADITLKEGSLYPLVVARLMSERVMKRISKNIHLAIWLNSAFIMMGLLDNSATGGSTRSVWLHNLTTLALSINALSPLLKEDKPLNEDKLLKDDKFLNEDKK